MKATTKLLRFTVALQVPIDDDVERVAQDLRDALAPMASPTRLLEEVRLVSDHPSHARQPMP